MFCVSIWKSINGRRDRQSTLLVRKIEKKEIILMSMIGKCKKARAKQTVKSMRRTGDIVSNAIDQRHFLCMRSIILLEAALEGFRRTIPHS